MGFAQIALEIFGGLGLFIYGVHLLSGGLESIAGSKMQQLLEKATKNPFKGAAFGAVGTALLQSSSLMMVSIIGLMNANLLGLTQAISIMLGQEIGTTLTGQLIAFKIGDFYLLFLGIGFILMFFTKKPKLQKLGQVIFGLGIIFLALKTMSGGAKAFSKDPIFSKLLLNFSQNLVLAVGAGAVFTALIQSSSAMTGLIVAMGIENAITLPVAIGLILGANIGTTITGILASLKSTIASKRAAYAQVIINIGGALLFLPFIIPFATAITYTSAELPRQIANAHTIFNVSVSILMFPFIKAFAKFLEKIVPGKDKIVSKKTRFIDDNLLSTPFGIKQARKEVHRIAGIVNSMLIDSEKVFLKYDKKILENATEKEQTVDDLCKFTENFLDRIPRNIISESDAALVNELKHNITDVERVGDLSYKLLKSYQKTHDSKLRINSAAKKDISNLYKKVNYNYALAVKVILTSDKNICANIIKFVEEIDYLEIKLKDKHLKSGRRSLKESDVIFETIRTLSRISDHADNIAHAHNSKNIGL